MSCARNVGMERVLGTWERGEGRRKRKGGERGLENGERRGEGREKEKGEGERTETLWEKTPPFHPLHKYRSHSYKKVDNIEGTLNPSRLECVRGMQELPAGLEARA